MLARCYKFLLPDNDFLGQILVKLHLLGAELLDFANVNLSLLEVLAGEVVLHNFPLFGQVHTVLKPCIQLLIFLIELRLALR